MAEISQLKIAKKMKRAKPAERIKLRAKLLVLMPSPLRKWFESIEDRVTDMVRRNLVFYWKLGEEAKEVHENEGKFGVKGVDICAAAFQEDKSVLYKAMRFHQAYDAEELKYLLSVTMRDTGRPVLWSHVLILIAVANKVKRAQYLKKLLENAWTDEELKSYVEHDLGKTFADRAIAGRKPKVPTTFDKLLSNMDANLSPLGTRLTEVYLHEAHGLMQRALDTDPADFTPGLLQEIDTLANVIVQIKDGMGKMEKQMATVRKHVVTALQNQAKQTGADDAETMTNGATKAPAKAAAAVE